MTSLLRLFVLAAALWPAAALAVTSSVVTTDQVRAELVAHAPDGVAPGKTLWLGLAITHQPKWHTYWKNPGDSGLPTSLAWQLPAGVEAGEIQWPTPQRLPVGPLLNYGYEGQLLLPVPVTVPAFFAASALDVKLRADWLVCKDVCIPEGGDFVLRVPAQAATVGHAALFDAARAAQPAERAGVAAQARVLADAQTLLLRVSGLPAAWQGRELQWFPEEAGVIENAAPRSARWDGAAWEVSTPLAAQRSESPAHMHAVLTTAGEAAGVRVGFAVAGPWPAPAAAPAAAAQAAAPTPAGQAVAPAPPPAPVAPAAPPIGLGLALLFALVGGALLNLMPCVFPVLSLKVIGFAQQAHDRPRLVAGGLAYTAGVIVSFVALAALLLALRAGGEQIGWGFQLQSPGFVAALAALFTLIGLNLAGLFEFGSLLPSRLAAARARHPLADSALTGVLAVAVASPCTAPFMGASLGLAATLPATQALAVFAALGLGMALPYLAASAWPGLARALPRPGAWMARFKTLMAFPMFATVVWLVWVLGQQVGIDGAAALLALLVALAFVAWAFGTPGMTRRARAGFGAAAIALFGSTLAWAWPTLREAPAPSTAAAAVSADGWQPWSAARVAELLAEGRPVFVDFTAAWCVTCQLNKRTTLDSDALRADFAARRVALLRADWTRRDPAIAAALAQLGRNGVPVYALYQPGAAEPTLLPEILSVQTVRDALGSSQ
jgi:thiol:disulfide interchange protein/DsbC/DsbD-like thiol-disulfide interchange protein